MTRDRQALIESILACPSCHGSLAIAGEDIHCAGCNASYRKINGTYYFRHVVPSDRSDRLDRLKEAIRRHHRLYGILLSVVAPTLKMKNLRRFVPAGDAVVIDLGSGNSLTDGRWIRLDYFDYPNVDIVCDAERLPIRSGSVDCHYNISLLEHILNPEATVAEIHRTLMPGGTVVSSVPFLVPFHASPHDYHRFTSSGVLHLFRNFVTAETGVRSGPFSSLLWIFQETVASLLSFGSDRLRNVWLILLYLALFPLKICDAVFLLYPRGAAENAASNFYYVGKKP